MKSKVNPEFSSGQKSKIQMTNQSLSWRQARIQNLYFLIPILCILVFVNCQKAGQGKIIAKVNNDVITEAEFVQALPGGFPSDSVEKEYRPRLLDQIIHKKLFIQEAKKHGLDKEIEPVFLKDMKTILVQALYGDVVTKNVKIKPKEIVEAKNLIATEVHLKLIIVPDENTAQMVNAEIKKGVGFDTLAKIYSQDPSGQNGGDIGFVPILYFEEPVRNVLVKMKVNEISKPIKCVGDFKIVNFLEKRQSTDSGPSLKDNVRMILEQEKSQKLAMDYLTKMHARLQYNPEGLKLFYKNVDEITPEQGEIWVVKKDKKKIVKVKNLLHVARQFPASLDTAMRSYAVRREIEDDVLYEDALARNLDKKPDISIELETRKNDLLYEKFCLAEITQKIDVSEQEIQDYYNLHKAGYGKSKLAEVSQTIRNTIFTNKRQILYQTITENLKSKGIIEINEKLLLSATKPKTSANRTRFSGKSNKTGGK